MEKAGGGDKRSEGQSNLCCSFLQSVAGEEIEEALSLQQGECTLGHQALFFAVL